MLKKISLNNEGVTLAETLVAAAIAAFAIVALLQAYFTNIYLADLSKGSTVAIDDLKDMMEKIESTPFNDVCNQSQYNTTSVIGNYSMRAESINVTCVNNASDPLEILVNINWTDSRGGKHSNYLTTKKTR